MRASSRLKRLESMARNQGRRAAMTSRPALLDSIRAKLDRVERGEVLEPTDWTNAPPDVVAHRDKLLEWLHERD